MIADRKSFFAALCGLVLLASPAPASGPGHGLGVCPWPGCDAGSWTAVEVMFTPDDGGEWTDPDPTEVDAALEALVVRMVAAEAGGSGSGNSVVKLLAEDPTDGEYFENLMHFIDPVTATSIQCQCQGGGTMHATWDNDGTLVRDSGTGEIVCSTDTEDLTLTGDVTFAAGSDANLLIDTKSGTVDVCQFFMYVTED